jgi:hypothetical protein
MFKFDNKEGFIKWSSKNILKGHVVVVVIIKVKFKTFTQNKQSVNALR